jgi:uncharacterized repeat protein (TIGR01451 family)
MRKLLLVVIMGMVLFYRSDEILGQVQASHPRLFFYADDIPDLRNKANTSHQEIWEPILEYADSLLGTLPPSSAPFNGDEEAFRNFGNQLIPLAFACVITGDADYCELTKDYLLTYSSWELWDENNLRDLGLAHMLMGNAIAYDWIYELLAPDEQQFVLESLITWGERLYEASSQPRNDEWGNWWGQSYLQNHFSTNNSALGIAGLALLGEATNTQAWIDHAERQIAIDQTFLNSIGDGSWHEGIAYQNYKLTMLIPFIYNLRRLQGVNLLADDYFQNYPAWRIYNQLPNTVNSILAYGNFEYEWGNNYASQNVLRFIASEYRDGHAEWMAQQLIANGRFDNIFQTPWYVFEFLYYDPTVAPNPPNDLPLTRVFPDLQGVVWRTGWNQDALIFGFKTGAYGGVSASETFVNESYPWNAPCQTTGCQLNIGHNHDDMNGFYLYRAGTWLSPESEGAGKYDTAFHNTLLIDGEGQYRPPDTDSWRIPADFEDRDAFLEETASTRNFDYLSADATNRYDIDDLNDLTRHILFVRPNYFLILDNLSSDANHVVDWVAHMNGALATQGDWIWSTAPDGQILGVMVVSPDQYHLSTGNDGNPFIRIRPSSFVNEARLINILYPSNTDEWNTRPTPTLLDDTGEAVAVRLDRSDGGRDDILLTYVAEVSDIDLAAYYFHARTAFVAHDADGNPERLFVHGGTFLIDEDDLGDVLVENLSESEPFEAVYQGNHVAVYGNIVSPVRLYAPDVRTLTINDVPSSFTRSGDYIILASSAVTIPRPIHPVVPVDTTIELKADPPFSQPGEVVTWTINIRNADRLPATKVLVEDVFSSELEIVSAFSTVGDLKVDGRTLRLRQERFEPEQEITILVTSRVRSDVNMPFIIANTASIRHKENPIARFAHAQLVSATRLPAAGERTWPGWYIFLLVAGIGLMVLEYLFRSQSSQV